MWLFAKPTFVNRLRGRTWPILQTALAATTAWYAAVLLLPDGRPSFASIAAVICLGASYGQRGSKALQLIAGVVLGICVASALVALIGAGSLQIGLMVVLGWLLIPPFFRSETHFVAMPVVDYEVLDAPPIPFSREDVQGFEPLADLLARRGEQGPVVLAELQTSEAMRSLLAGQLRNVVGRNKDVLILYLSANGVSDAGSAYLLCSDFDPTRPDTGRQNVRDVLKQIAACPAAVKLVILDSGRIVADPRLGMIAMVRGGASSGFYWNPEDEKGSDCAGCLWTPTDSADGGRKLPMFDLVSRFHRAFPPGTKYTTVSVAADDVPNVRVLATDRTVLVVNTLDRSISAKVDGKRFEMQAYEVKWLDR